MPDGHAWKEHDCGAAGCFSAERSDEPVLRLGSAVYRFCPVREAVDAGHAHLPGIVDLMRPAMGSPSYPFGGGQMNQPAILMDAVNAYVVEFDKHAEPAKKG